MPALAVSGLKLLIVGAAGVGGGGAGVESFFEQENNTIDNTKSNLSFFMAFVGLTVLQ